MFDKPKQDVNSPRWASIDAIGSYLPVRILTNTELAPEVGWTSEEILAKTGIAERHIAGADECVSDMAVAAGEKVLRETGIDPASIQFLIVCTQTPDQFLPATACMVQHRLGLSNRCAAFDINQGCSGYVYSLGVANGLIRSGMAERGLVITADTYTKFINPHDRSVRTLFGDAATATLVSANAQPGLDHFVFGTDGSGAKNLCVPAGGTRLPRSPQTSQPVTDSSGNTRCANDLFMNGQEVFAFTIKRVPGLVSAALDSAKLRVEDVDWFVLHQANRYMLDHLQKKLNLPTDRTVSFLRDVGNTVSSTIPLALENCVREGRVQPGHRLLLVGFGVGYSWGAALLRWTGRQGQ